jgi:hypothetical protein
VFGTVTAAMRLMRLDEEQCLNAFGIAYAQAAGEFQMYEEASQTVSIQQGLRARSGIDSAEMARAGLNGPHEVFFGRYGFYRAFEPVHDVDLLLRDFGKDFVCRELSYKPYPCCKCMHPAIFATLQLREREHVQPDDITGIRIGTNRMCSEFLAQPRDLKWNPPTQVAAKFSLPYGVSVAAAKGAVGIADFEQQALSDPTCIACLQLLQSRSMLTSSEPTLPTRMRPPRSIFGCGMVEKYQTASISARPSEKSPDKKRGRRQVAPMRSKFDDQTLRKPSFRYLRGGRFAAPGKRRWKTYGFNDVVGSAGTSLQSAQCRMVPPSAPGPTLRTGMSSSRPNRGPSAACISSGRRRKTYGNSGL